MSKVIGIDLGTTNSCVAIFEQGRPLVLGNQEGSTTTPSMVAYTSDGQKLIGAIAKRQIISDPENTFYSIKRLIGRKFDSPEVEQARSFISYPVDAAENGDIIVKIRDHHMSLPEIQAEILATMKRIAEHHIMDRITEAVITVPAYFNDAQRQATKDAGQIAGLKILRIINEPTAASLAYGLDKSGRSTIAVYDLGGGTFDISILEIGDGVFQVKATSGDTFLGGDDFDQKIVDHLLDQFRQKEGLDLTENKVAMQRLKKAAEETKHTLSVEEEAEINLPFLAITPKGPRHLKTKLTKHELEEMVGDLIERTLEPCRQALRDSNMAVEDIQVVVLVGGQTRMPKIRQVVKDFFGREPHTNLNPDEVVAIGAAIQGAVLRGDFEDVLLLDVTPLSLGLETKGGLFTTIIGRNTTIPTRRGMLFTTTEDNQTSVNVHILQGERNMAADNTSLSNFELLGIPPAPRGFPKIEVTFDIDANGILSVSARDTGTGSSQAIRITPSSGLTSDEINRIIKESRELAEEDKRKKKLAILQNEAEAAIYAAVNLSDKYSHLMTDKQKGECLKHIKKIREASEKEDTESIQKALKGIRIFSDDLLKYST